MKLRFELWKFVKKGYMMYIVRDNSFPIHARGSVLGRDQSSYEEDGGKMVWKNQAYPASTWFTCVENGGECVMTSSILELIPADLK